MEAGEELRCWDSLPLEIGDLILHFVVQGDPHRSNNPGLLMEVVLCFVCRTWKERKSSWGIRADKKSDKTIIPAKKKIKRRDWYGGKATGAAASINLALLKWARDHGCPIDHRTTAVAARLGDLEMVKWLREQGCSWDETACSGAAKGGHLEVLKWLKSNGCPWDPWSCSEAARTARLDVLLWLKENGCSWDVRTFAVACSKGNMEVIKWLHVNGCHWNEDSPNVAARKGKPWCFLG